MNFHKILAGPVSPTSLKNYKGLYRVEPFPKSDKNERLISLWLRYCQYNESAHMGITAELAMGELKELAKLSTFDTGEQFEVVFCGETLRHHPHPTLYYGMDVTGWGGYSMVGEGMFCPAEGAPQLEACYHHYKSKLNEYGLFGLMEDAVNFCSALNEIEMMAPGAIENEDWRVIHISKVL